MLGLPKEPLQIVRRGQRISTRVAGLLAGVVTAAVAEAEALAGAGTGAAAGGAGVGYSWVLSRSNCRSKLADSEVLHFLRSRASVVTTSTFTQWTERTTGDGCFG